MRTKRKLVKGLVNVLVWALILELNGEMVSGAVAQSRDACADRLIEAEKKYDGGYFEEAIRLIKSCMSQQHITKKQMATAYKLLAKVYVSREMREEAMKAFLSMFELNSDIAIDAGKEKPEVVEIYQEARDIYEKTRKKSSKKWYWIGAAFVVGILAGVLVAGDK